jgi:hypothetical protein
MEPVSKRSPVPTIIYLRERMIDRSWVQLRKHVPLQLYFIYFDCDPTSGWTEFAKLNIAES